jgi:hypothetical protein
LGIAISSSGFYYQIFNDFTKFRNKRQNLALKNKNKKSILDRIGKYLGVILKLSSIGLLALIFVILLNTFGKYRNVCCVDFMESFLNDESHAIHIVKQLCLTAICIYIFYFSHSRTVLAMNSLLEIVRYFLDFSQSKTQESVNTNLAENRENNTDENEELDDDEVSQVTGKSDYELIANNSSNIYNQTIVPVENSNICFNFHSKEQRDKITTWVVYIVCFFITLVQLSSISKQNMMYLWTITFLFLNFAVVSISLLINYFPYQVLVDSKQTVVRKSGLLFRNREESPLIRQNEVKTKGSIYKPIQLAETAQFNDPQSEEAGNNLNFGSSLKHNNTFIRKWF